MRLAISKTARSATDTRNDTTSHTAEDRTGDDVCSAGVYRRIAPSPGCQTSIPGEACLFVSGVRFWKGEPMKNSRGRAGSYRDFGHVIEHNGCLSTSRNCFTAFFLGFASCRLPQTLLGASGRRNHKRSHARCLESVHPSSRKPRSSGIAVTTFDFSSQAV